jgi:hypothetical protein
MARGSVWGNRGKAAAISATSASGEGLATSITVSAGCAQQPHVAHVGGQRSSSSVPLSKLVLQGSGVSRLVIPETPAASKATTTTSANRRMMGL